MRSRAAAILDDLHVVPASHRELFRYYEHCRIRVDDHRVVCWSRDAEGNAEANAIPYCNVAFVLLGPGTSISSDAMELLAAGNVVVGFTGGKGSPLNAGVEPVVFAAGASEYRPTEYMQGWARWWFDDNARREKAMSLLSYRAELIETIWQSKRMKDLCEQHHVPPPSPASFFKSVPGVGGEKRGVFSGGAKISAAEYAGKVFSSMKTEGLLGQEGLHVSGLYRYFATLTGVNFECRDQAERGGINGLLTQGNYIAYGLAATALHGMGISFAFPLLHGKTRRGALVFDIADPIKDAVIVPLAFLAGRSEILAGSPDGFRQMTKGFIEDTGLLADTMEKIKWLALG